MGAWRALAEKPPLPREDGAPQQVRRFYLVRLVVSCQISDWAVKEGLRRRREEASSSRRPLRQLEHIVRISTGPSVALRHRCAVRVEALAAVRAEHRLREAYWQHIQRVEAVHEQKVYVTSTGSAWRLPQEAPRWGRPPCPTQPRFGVWQCSAWGTQPN